MIYQKFQEVQEGSNARQFGSFGLLCMTVANAKPITDRWAIWAVWMLLAFTPTIGDAAEGTLTLRVVDEATGKPIAARVELTRPTLTASRTKRRTSRRDAFRIVRPLPARGAIGTSFGFVLEDSLEINLKEGPYQFRVTRGPEYRVIQGNFAIEKTSVDEHVVSLSRILNMKKLGWISGDCLVPQSKHRSQFKNNLERRMSAEGLQVATEEGGEEGNGNPQIQVRAGIVFYDLPDKASKEVTDQELATLKAIGNVAQLRREKPTSLQATTTSQPRIAIENPFAWPLPVYLSSQQIDGCFVLGDWLRLDATIRKPSSGRPYPDEMLPDDRSLGREVEQIYWEMLNCGFRIAPLAGSGDEAVDHPVGYNRLYVASDLDVANDAGSSSTEASINRKQWWDGVWRGGSFATNGPLMQPKLDGKLPGHVFSLSSGEELNLTPELTLTVQDPVEYLEVILNGMIHTTTKLDEFAKAGGRLKPIRVNQSGWALIRVVTLHKGHFRAAMTAPWYFEVDGQPRISKRSVKFFQSWLADYESELKKRSVMNLAKYAPFIRGARRFWTRRSELATHR